MPETLYTTTPVSDNTVWYSGKEFQTQTTDSLTVSIAFENEIGGTSTFYMVVGYSGAGTVLVAPERFYCYGVDTISGSVYSSSQNRTIKFWNVRTDTVLAIDPERQLNGINAQIAQANATYSTKGGINAATALLQLVGDLATIGQNKTDEQLDREEKQRRSLNASEARDQIDYSTQMESLASQREYWENATLRKTTLFPNTAIVGKVLFPVNTGLTSFKMVIPIDTTSIEFDFKQGPTPQQ